MVKKDVWQYGDVVVSGDKDKLDLEIDISLDLEETEVIPTLHDIHKSLM